ncbi:MAG TPA: hypothetical protein VNJ51_01860 [Candidatus Dormibacteraeota bacterium]|nr:hypothetical protein [Candidatus Dormibacteraeota bacterium]
MSGPHTAEHPSYYAADTGQHVVADTARSQWSAAARDSRNLAFDAVVEARGDELTGASWRLDHKKKRSGETHHLEAFPKGASLSSFTRVKIFKP